MVCVVKSEFWIPTLEIAFQIFMLDLSEVLASKHFFILCSPMGYIILMGLRDTGTGVKGCDESLVGAALCR